MAVKKVQSSLVCLLALTAALLSGAVRLCAQTNLGPMLRLGQVPGMNGYFLFVLGPQATNFVLETSADLKSWTTLYQAFGWPGTNPVYRIMQKSPSGAHAFWRAVPGEPLLVKEQRWTNQEPVEYRFRLRHMVSFWEGGVRGTVRVRDGRVVEVTDAVDDRTQQPIANPDLSRFLTIAQLFGEIRRAFEAASQQVQVRYDPSGLYPEWILVDRLLMAVDDETVIEASQLVVLQR